MGALSVRAHIEDPARIWTNCTGTTVGVSRAGGGVSKAVKSVLAARLAPIGTHASVDP